MTIETNSIGNGVDDPFLFIELHSGHHGGVPEVPMQALALIQRPGTDGTAFVFLGAKGKPFKMNSAATYETKEDAIAAIAGYRHLCALPAQNMVWSGFDLSTVDVAYKVLWVTTRLVKLGKAVGGVPVDDGTWMIEAEWELIPISTS